MKDKALHVLVVDDNPAIRKLLHTILVPHGHEVTEAADGNSALQTLRISRVIDVLLLELSLPDIDGLSIIRHIRALGSSMPIIVLSSREDEDAKVEALDLGADDYLTKPFGSHELLARIRVSLRHRNKVPQILKAGELTVNLVDRAVWLAGENIYVSPIEFSLLSLLMRNAGSVFTHADIALAVWGKSLNPQYIRVHIRSLRHKLHDYPDYSKFIVTEQGVGYKFGAYTEGADSPTIDDLNGENKPFTKTALKLGNIALVTQDNRLHLFIDGFPHILPSADILTLDILLQYQNRVVSKVLIADYVARGNLAVNDKSIEVYIHRLRRQLKNRGATVTIDTVKGAGYLISARPILQIDQPDPLGLASLQTWIRAYNR